MGLTVSRCRTRNPATRRPATVLAAQTDFIHRITSCFKGIYRVACSAQLDIHRRNRLHRVHVRHAVRKKSLSPEGRTIPGPPSVDIASSRSNLEGQFRYSRKGSTMMLTVEASMATADPPTKLDTDCRASHREQTPMPKTDLVQHSTSGLGLVGRRRPAFDGEPLAAVDPWARTLLALSGLRIVRDDTVYKPRTRGCVAPLNRDAMILSTEVRKVRIKSTS